MHRSSALFVFLSFLLLLTGCEYEEDYLDHVPPAGKGSLVVENNTAHDIDLFLNGEFATTVGDYRDRIIDFQPGVHRLVMDEDGGDTTFRSDIDILEGRLTILRVRVEAFNPEYIVSIDFE
jgi:hypothetical protein